MKIDISESECSALIRVSADHPTPMKLALTPGRGPGRTAMLDTEINDWTTRALVEMRVAKMIAALAWNREHGPKQERRD